MPRADAVIASASAEESYVAHIVYIAFAGDADSTDAVKQSCTEGVLCYGPVKSRIVGRLH